MNLQTIHIRQITCKPISYSEYDDSVDVWRSAFFSKFTSDSWKIKRNEVMSTPVIIRFWLKKIMLYFYYIQFTLYFIGIWNVLAPVRISGFSSAFLLIVWCVAQLGEKHLTLYSHTDKHISHIHLFNLHHSIRYRSLFEANLLIVLYATDKLTKW